MSVRISVNLRQEAHENHHCRNDAACNETTKIVHLQHETVKAEDNKEGDDNSCRRSAKEIQESARDG